MIPSTQATVYATGIKDLNSIATDSQHIIQITAQIPWNLIRFGNITEWKKPILLLEIFATIIFALVTVFKSLFTQIQFIALKIKSKLNSTSILHAHIFFSNPKLFQLSIKNSLIYCNKSEFQSFHLLQRAALRKYTAVATPSMKRQARKVMIVGAIEQAIAVMLATHNVNRNNFRRP